MMQALSIIDCLAEPHLLSVLINVKKIWQKVPATLERKLVLLKLIRHVEMMMMRICRFKRLPEIIFTFTRKGRGCGSTGQSKDIECLHHCHFQLVIDTNFLHLMPFV